MPYRAEMLAQSVKFSASLFGAGGLWIAQTAADATGGTINWVERYGITGAIIATLIMVVKLQYANDQKSRAEALAAKDALLVAAEKNAETHRATAMELIKATNNQTVELQKFTSMLSALDTRVAGCSGNLSHLQFKQGQEFLQQQPPS